MQRCVILTYEGIDTHINSDIITVRYTDISISNTYAEMRGIIVPVDVVA